MLDIGWQELFIVAVVAIIVIGPRELPRALKAMGQILRKARAMARDFQNGVDEILREAELDDLKKDLSEASPSSITRNLEHSIDPTGEVKEAVREVDPTKDVREALDTAEDAQPTAAPAPEAAAQAEAGPAPKRKAGGSS
ncbi:MAG: Sec-independent protein translocase protein TatB [Kiloniellales bacterium]